VSRPVLPERVRQALETMVGDLVEVAQDVGEPGLARGLAELWERFERGELGRDRPKGGDS
jgi:hypothetical protein